MSERIRLLSIEDSRADQLILERLLRRAPVELTTATTVSQGLDLARSRVFDCVLLDYLLPDASGLDFLAALKSGTAQAPPVVFVTGYEDEALGLEAVQAGAQDFLVKGQFSEEILVHTMRYAVERGRADALRQRLLRTEHMAMLGGLTAGVAHEINNPVSWVRANLDLSMAVLGDLRPQLDAPQNDALDEVFDMLADCLTGVSRIGAIARALQVFHDSPDEAELVSLDELVAAAVEIVRGELPRWIRVDTRLGGVPLVVGDRGRLVQVIANLILHASQSLGESPGTLLLATHEEWDGVVFELVHDDAAASSGELLDRLDPESRESAPPDLGLAVCQEIVTQAGGRIDASRLGDAMSIRVHLPMRPPETLPGQLDRPRVLLVDHEPRSLSAHARVLESGHEVVCAGDAASARALLADDADFDAMLLDLETDADGALVAWLEATHPALASRVVFQSSSGAPAMELDRPLVEKPASPARLTAVLQAAASNRHAS